MTNAREELAAGIQQQMIRFIADVILFNHSVSAKLGLGASDSQFMTLLQTHGPLTPRQLAEFSGLTSGTVTGVLDRLEAHGFVTRTPDRSDRRKVVVSPSLEAIQKTFMPLYAEQGARVQAVLATRTDKELQTILAFFTDALADD
jgi:DNA-binding MarR family transcriptional regulator